MKRQLLIVALISPIGVPISMYLYEVLSRENIFIANIGFLSMTYLNGLIGVVVLGIPVFLLLKRFKKEFTVLIIPLGTLCGFLFALPLLIISREFIPIGILCLLAGFTVSLISWILLKVLGINRGQTTVWK